MSRTLDQLRPGESARIAGLLLGGLRRRRLLDLGFVPGMSVERLQTGPFGDPTAYQVLDTVIALRRRDARCITSRNKKAPFCPSSEAEWRFLRFGK